MSYNQQSPRHSQNSSPLPPPSTTKSLIVSKVAFDTNDAKLLQDLQHNYLGVEKVSRLHGNDGKPIGAIRVDFKSDNLAMKILGENSILVNGKRHPVRPYWPSFCHRCQNEGHRAFECPQKPLTEQRVMELFEQQQMQLEAMINAFENKWDARLSSLSTSSTNTNVDQLLPIFKDLTTVCQQFNQQNSHMQRQLGSIVNRVQDVQTKLNNQQDWSQLPLKNGH